MSWRMKSKSGWLAEGNPTSTSLKPIWTTVSNIRSFRAGSIGSMSAWLPSRRSTEHQSGARSIRFVGHVRSSSGAARGEKGRYFSNGIRLAITFSGGMAGDPFGSENQNAPCVCRGRGGERDGALAATSGGGGRSGARAA